jgi:hypothetical protein
MQTRVFEQEETERTEEWSIILRYLCYLLFKRRSSF